MGSVGSKVETGVSKANAAKQVGRQQSDGLTAKRKDELYGRLTPGALAKFLNQKYP